MTPKKWQRSHTAGFQRFRPSPAELRRLVLAIPRDTRDVTGQLMNDPLPGRSALDAKRQEEDVK